MDGTPTSTAAPGGINQADLLHLIGAATNARLRELHRMLSWYTYTQQELKILREKIWATLPKRAKKRILENTEGK
jgi:hypothetical protein